MSDPRSVPAVIAWLKGTSGSPYEPSVGVQRVMTRVRRTRQRRRWWPALSRRSRGVGGDDASSVAGTTRSMVSPSGAVVAVVLVLGIAGALLLVRPFDGSPTLPPGVTTPAEGMEPSFFSGTIGGGFWTPISEAAVEQREDGVVVIAGEGWGDVEFATNDPRISGTLSMIKNETDYREGALADSPTGQAGTIRSGLFRIENEDGYWEGPITNLGMEEPEWELDAGWLTGHGAYDGLVAYVAIEDTESIRGHISLEGAPPFPSGFPSGE